VVVAVVLVMPQDQLVLVDQALEETEAQLIQTVRMELLIEVVVVVDVVEQAHQPEMAVQAAPAS
jgi:hypothetical protein